MGFVSVEMLSIALREKLKGKTSEDEDIEKLAEYILSFFGFEDRIIDNVLSNEDRDMFYFLEDNGILRSGFEDTTIEKGKPWRIHYWILNKEEIFRIIDQANLKKRAAEEEEYALYDNPDFWRRSGNSHESR